MKARLLSEVLQASIGSSHTDGLLPITVVCLKQESSAHGSTLQVAADSVGGEKAYGFKKLQLHMSATT